MKYPFSPDILDAIPEELAELFRTLELTLLQEISKRLMAADQLNEVTVQAIRALRSHGISVEEIKKAIRKATGISKKKLDALLDDVIERNQKYYRGLADIAQITAPEMLVKKQDIEAIVRQTKEELENITRTMGFVVDSGRTVLEPTQAYKWALDKAEMAVQSGVISYNQAIAAATKELADSGVTVISYDSGHRDQVDVAVRRAVMTGVNQLNSRYAEDSMDYLETEYVEVSAHAGARDKDGPLGWENHKKWQGKVYWWKERSKGKPEHQYPEFEKTCGYGSVTGILGANCRHNYSPFIPDVMERTYTDEELVNIDPPDFEYEGKKYTHYEATQQQRAIERAVRKWKRREAAATSPEDKQAAQIRQRLLKQKYEEFSKAAHLRTQPERMKAYVPPKKAFTSSGDSGIIKLNNNGNYMNQAAVDAEIPEEYRGDFSDFEQLDLSAAEKKAFVSLRGAVQESGYEHGAAMLNGQGSELFTSNMKDKVQIPQEYLEADGVKLYHGHTNCTPPSHVDLKYLLKQNVSEVGVVTANGDVFTVSRGSGVLATEDEFDAVVGDLYREINGEVMREALRNGWTAEQANYVAVREQFFRTSRHFGWTMRGGRL